jgi:hypothetical protein
LKQFSSITVPEISDQIVAIVGLFATFFWIIKISLYNIWITVKPHVIFSVHSPTSGYCVLSRIPMIWRHVKVVRQRTSRHSFITTVWWYNILYASQLVVILVYTTLDLIQSLVPSYYVCNGYISSFMTGVKLWWPLIPWHALPSH